MVTYQAIMVEEYSFHLEKEYEKLIEKADPVIERFEEQDPRDGWSHFLLGAYYGLKGIYQVRRKSYLSGFSNGYKGIVHLEKSVEAAPPLYDAYLGLGVYGYWKGALGRRHWYLKFLPDSRAEGIGQIGLAAEKGCYSVGAGRLALLFIYYNERLYSEARGVADLVLSHHPRSVIARVIRARSLAMNSRYRAAIDEMKKTAALAPELSLPYYYLGLFRHHARIEPDAAMRSFRRYTASPRAEKRKLSYAHLYIGELLAARGEWKAAEAAMTRAAEIYPENPLIEEKLEWLERRRPPAPAN